MLLSHTHLSVLLLFFLSSRTTRIVFGKVETVLFSIDNVPSLFRCSKDGLILYFNRFPTQHEFQQAVSKTNRPCDWSFEYPDRTGRGKLDELEFLCGMSDGRPYADELLHFSFQCASNPCQTPMPSLVTLITRHADGKVLSEQVNVTVPAKHPDKPIIARFTYGRYRNSVRCSFSS